MPPQDKSFQVSSNEKQTTKNNETDQVDFSIAEKWNGIAAIVGCVAAFASYSFTGQIIPGLV